MTAQLRLPTLHEASVSIAEPSAPALAPARAVRRQLGAYYTPKSAADFMADWIIRRDGDHILEPSFGNGMFLRALSAASCRKQFTSLRLSGVEIDETAREGALREQLIADSDARIANFLSVAPFAVSAVIGNPPYVRLRHLPYDQQQCGLSAARAAMNDEMDPSGSLWMPFVLHAMRFLENGGRLAFVLPYDVTYVRYARPLWQFLGQKFGSLHVLRTHERIFSDLLQDVVILLADNYGAATDTIRFQAFERVDDLLHSRPARDTNLEISDVLCGERVFIDALLGEELHHLLRARVAILTTPARQLVTFNIGYVAGDKDFFHPSADAVRNFNLPTRSLHPSLISSRLIRGVGLATSSITQAQARSLFLPNPANLSEEEQRYITYGEQCGVSMRYKCRIRDPWYVVPGTRIPDLVLSVFSERPVLMVNDAECFASNSLLCGYCVAAARDEIAMGWYTSLTLLQMEREVHALGGGVMVLVPREAGSVRLPTRLGVSADHLSRLDGLLRVGDTAGAYALGDDEVLQEQLGLCRSDISLIQEGVETLTHWRTSARATRN